MAFCSFGGIICAKWKYYNNAIHGGRINIKKNISKII